MAITSRDQIVNMDDVYKFYGKDNGMINNGLDEFLTRARNYLSLLTENNFINVGSVGSQVLFENMLEELRVFEDEIYKYTDEKCKYFKRLNAKQEAEFQAYQARIEKELEKRNERWANIG